MKIKYFFSAILMGMTFNSYSQVKVNVSREEGQAFVNFQDVADLYKQISWSADGKKLTVVRSADNNEFTLNIDNGELVWKGQIIGIVPNAKKIKPNSLNLPINVVETLTGTNVKLDGDSATFNFDVQLQASNNWILFINKEQASTQIKSVGNVLLLPIDLVASKLGSSVDFVNGTIFYRRLQDSARIELNIASGLVKVNDRIQGTVGNLFYIDQTQKLVPLNIVEILAGIVIEIEASKHTVNISLDPRIASTVYGSKLIAQELKDTPLTVQSLGYDVNSEGAMTLKLDTYFSSYNTRINYQSGGNILEHGGAKPALLNFQWSSFEGSSGTIGDVNLGNRQLSGINVSRIRGIEYNNTIGDYNFSLTSGQIVQNYNDIYAQQFADRQNNSNSYIPLKFGGAAYGIRIYPKDKPYELGLSYLDDPQLGRKWAVGSFTYKSQNTQKEAWNYYLNVDAGQLTNKLSITEEKSGFDIKTVWSANRPFESFNVSLDGNYSGQLFEQYYQPTLQNLINTSNGVSSNPLSPLLPNAENAGFSRLSQNANIAYKISESLSVSYGINYNQRKNDVAKYDYLIHNLGFSKSFKDGSISFNNLFGKGVESTGEYKVNIYNATAQKQFEYINMLTRLDYDAVTKVYNGQVSGQFPSYKHQMGEFSGTFNSSVSYNFYKRANLSNQSMDANLNYTIASNSALKGWTLGAGAGAAWKLFQNSSNPDYVATPGSDFNNFGNRKINPFFFANASYHLSRAFKFQVSASIDSLGKARIFAGINGDIDFAPPRTVSNYIAKKGVVKGKVFIDDNYNGVLDSDETKPISVLVSIKGTGLSLRTTNEGNFTIQNLNPGLYELGVSFENLPLGWALDDKVVTRFSINEDQITQINLPIRHVYDLTGQAVAEGAISSSIEGLTVELYEPGVEAAIKKTLTTFGGQFSFDGLKPGKYTVKIYDTNEKMYSQDVQVQEKQKKYIFELK